MVNLLYVESDKRSIPAMSPATKNIALWAGLFWKAGEGCLSGPQRTVVSSNGSSMAVKFLIALIAIFAVPGAARSEFVISSIGNAAGNQANEGLFASMSATRDDSSRESRTDTDVEQPVLRLDELYPFGLAAGPRGGCSSTDTSPTGSSSVSSAAVIHVGCLPVHSECQGKLSLESLKLPLPPDPLELLDPPKPAQ